MLAVVASEFASPAKSLSKFESLLDDTDDPSPVRRVVDAKVVEVSPLKIKYNEVNVEVRAEDTNFKSVNVAGIEEKVTLAVVDDRILLEMSVYVLGIFYPVESGGGASGVVATTC